MSDTSAPCQVRLPVAQDREHLAAHDTERRDTDPDPEEPRERRDNSTGGDEDTEEEKTWQIVGDSEADAKSGRISISSPMARALVGKKVGTSVEVHTPKGPKGYEIAKVRWA